MSPALQPGKSELRDRAGLPDRHRHHPGGHFVPALRLRGGKRGLSRDAAHHCRRPDGHPSHGDGFIAEIATNQKVEGGGEYYIISRSFGINIGAAIGIALYLSQAISVAAIRVGAGSPRSFAAPSSS
jgi:hypothetical protein